MDIKSSERMTLREAAERTSRSITTLRRYIRSNRLHADKRYGRFGPEYFVSEHDLAAAGLDPAPDESRSTALEPRDQAASTALVRPAELPIAESVPLLLYQELQMKHEQLLVQYGMVRASGLRMMDLQGDLEVKERRIEEQRVELARQRENHDRENARMRKQVREAFLELQARALEIAALQEKVRALELLNRNAVTNETLDKQFRDLSAQSRHVDRLAAASRPRPQSLDRLPPESGDH